MQPNGTEDLASPALLFDRGAILANLDQMIRLVDGDVSRLRPHAKTHKCAEILSYQLERGIEKAKCATIAEAELAARTGVPDVLLSYPAIGPTTTRLQQLAHHYPRTRFSTLVDSLEGYRDLEALGESSLSVYLDLDIGMSRTGITAGEQALSLIHRILDSPHLRWSGIHAYDGHIHDADLETRTRRFHDSMEELGGFIDRLEAEGILIPHIVSGGSPTFALHARAALASGRSWECSPGTTLLWDAGYQEHYPELGFACAAFLLARVVSHPGDDLLCLDLGHKAVSGENPLENRVRFPGMPEHEFVSQSEEHLVLRCADRNELPVGSSVIGVPYHVCPTVALHETARITEKNQLLDEVWIIEARKRSIGC